MFSAKSEAEKLWMIDENGESENDKMASETDNNTSLLTWVKWPNTNHRHIAGNTLCPRNTVTATDDHRQKQTIENERYNTNMLRRLINCRIIIIIIIIIKRRNAYYVHAKTDG